MPIYVPAPESTIRKHVENMLLHRDELIPALSALAAEMPRGQSRRELQHLVRRLKEGASASALMSDPAAAIWLTHASAARGDASQASKMMSALAFAHAEADSRSQSRSVMLYPIVVVLLALILMVVLCFTVVPTFAKMYSEFGLMLPGPTRLLVWISDTLTNKPLVSLAIMVATVAVISGLFQLWNRFSLATRLLGRFAAGNSASVAAMAKLTNQLAELLEMGASLPESLWFAGQTCGDRHLRNLSVQLANHANQGTLPLAQSSVAHQFPGNVIHALSIEGEAKPNTVLLHELSVMYRHRVRTRIDWSSGVASPLATLAVAAVVAFVVFSLFIPLFSLVSGLS